MFPRKLHNYLLQWKKKSNRKPLIIRGARQVGKSTLVKEFGKEFRYFISLNLDNPRDKKVFEDLDQVKDIIEAIFLKAAVPFTGEPTLIFMDEIQESPKAIKLLRYFHEDYPELFFIAAGSLLEFAMKDVPSFPVGRVEQVVLHPFDFEEFLSAIKRDDLILELGNIPLKKSAHSIFLDHFNDYAIIGGMPEVIKRYSEEKSFINLGEIYSNLWQSYRDDVEKYASNPTERKIIRHIIDTAPFEGERITMAGFGNSNYRSREAGEALRALDMARIIQLIYPSTNLEPPAVPNLTRKPRLQFLDTGLLNFSLGNQAEMIGISDLNNYSRGRIIQHLVIQQLQAQSHSVLYKPVFWVREKSNSNAEVDILIKFENYLIPVEVKSGGQGALRSMHQFIEHCSHKFGVRLLGNYFSVEKVNTPGGVPYTLMNLPYYASTRIVEYIRWYAENNPMF